MKNQAPSTPLRERLSSRYPLIPPNQNPGVANDKCTIINKCTINVQSLASRLPF